MNRTVLAVLIPLALVACEPYTYIKEDKTVVDEFDQDPAEQVDILLVVDNSCSMLAEQEKLSQEFEAFVEFFYIANTDYHIGITTTDMDPSGERGNLVGPMITRQTSNPGAVFQETIMVGTDGSGYEQGLLAAKTALSPNMQAANGGFYREEAELSIIFVTDEDDASPGTTSEYLHEFFDIKGQRNRRAFQASLLGGVNPITGEPESCGYDEWDLFAGSDDTPRYVDIALRSGGVASSLCADDFNGIVNTMGLAASRLTDRFFLSYEPKDLEVEVRIFLPGTPEYLDNGIVLAPMGLPESGLYAWVIETDGELYWVRFSDIDNLPPIGSHIRITYQRF